MTRHTTHDRWRTLTLLAATRGHRRREDQMYGCDEAEREQLLAEELIEAVETRPMLVKTSAEGGPEFGEVTVYRITQKGRQELREHQQRLSAERILREGRR